MSTQSEDHGFKPLSVVLFYYSSGQRRHRLIIRRRTFRGQYATWIICGLCLAGCSRDPQIAQSGAEQHDSKPAAPPQPSQATPVPPSTPDSGSPASDAANVVIPQEGVVASVAPDASARAQSKLPSNSSVICYGDYGSLVSTLSDYCKDDKSCSGVRKPAAGVDPVDGVDGLAYFLQAERDLGKSTYRESPGWAVVTATGGPGWVIGVLRHRGMTDLSGLSEKMASICAKGDVNAKAVAEMEYYSETGKAIGKCDAVVMCK